MGKDDNGVLAIHGGTPVRARPYPAWPVWDESEGQALLKVLHSRTWGVCDEEVSQVAAFERSFAAYQGAAYGRCVSSGTSALMVALRAAGVGYGDEVIVPPYTFVATASACLMVGAMPVFVDIEPEAFTLDPRRIEEALTERTRAIIPVHIAGCPARMDDVLEVARRYGLAVVEDACQAHGAAWKGRPVGALGDLGCFSFQSSKNLSAGEGGIVLTDGAELAARCWSLRNCGRVPDGVWYQHELLAGNLRMTEWQGAVLLAQLERAEVLAQRRERRAAYLSAALEDVEGVRRQRPAEGVTRHAYHLYLCHYDAAAFGGWRRDDVVAALRAEGIPCSPGYVPLYSTGTIQRGIADLCSALGRDRASLPQPDCPVTERLCAEEAFWFPQSVLLGDEGDAADLVTALLKIQRASRS